MQVETVDRKKYFVTFKDDFSRFRKVVTIRNKSDVAAELRTFLAEAKVQGHTVRSLRTDGGGEYVNEEIKRIQSQAGFEHLMTMPHTPQQNGAAERENGILMSTARALLHTADLPKQLWGEAVQTAAYVLNRTANSGSAGKSPPELWTGQKPDLSKLHVFGEKVVFHIPAADRRKLDNRGQDGQFVGYDHHDGFRIWVAKSRKIIRSTDVKFMGQLIPKIPTNIADDDESDSDAPECFMSNHKHVPIFPDNSMSKSNGEKSDKLGAAGSQNVAGGSISPWGDCSLGAATSYPLGDDDSCEDDDAELEPDDDADEQLLNDIGPDTDADRIYQPIRSDPDESDPDDGKFSTDMLQLYSGEAAMVTDSGDADPVDGNSSPESSTLSTTSSRRSTRKTQKPVRLQYGHATGKTAVVPEDLVDEPEPRNFAEARKSKVWPHWDAAMRAEFKVLHEAGTYEVDAVPAGRKALRSKWVFKLKKDAAGNPTKYKARLVVCGCAQISGIDYDETYSAVARAETFRMLIAVAADEKLHLATFDVVSAYLNGKLEESIWMRQPDGYTDGTGQAWHLIKSLYGLKQSGRCWNQVAVNALKKVGLTQSDGDPCLFVREGEQKLLLTLYVDDGLIAAKYPEDIDVLLADLSKEFQLTRSEATSYLGCEIIRSDSGIFLRQSGYIQKMMKRFNVNRKLTIPAVKNEFESGDNTLLHW